MIYLLLTILAVLLTIIALGLTIAGIVKKKNSLWISSLAAFVIFTLVSVFSGVTYVSDSIDYMATDEFQEKTKKSASNWGKNIGNTVSGAAEGLETTLNHDAILKLAEKTGVILGGSVKSVSTGIDESVAKHMVYADKEIEDLGIYLGRAKWASDSSKYELHIFLEFRNNFDGKLKLTSFDNEGKKIETSTQKIEQQAGDDKIFVFKFTELKPNQSEYCILSKLPSLD